MTKLLVSVSAAPADSVESIIAGLRKLGASPNAQTAAIQSIKVILEEYLPKYSITDFNELKNIIKEIPQ